VSLSKASARAASTTFALWNNREVLMGKISMVIFVLIGLLMLLLTILLEHQFVLAGTIP